MRLIDADFVLSRVKPYSIDDENWYVTGGTANRLIHNAVDTAPTVDAVPVVRCGECKRWDADPDSYGKDDGPKGKCMKSLEETNDDDFCSYGERKDSVE